MTATKTVEGLLSDQAQPNQGVKQKFQSMYEALSRKHAMEYAKMQKDFGELVRASEKGEKEEVTKTSASEKEKKKTQKTRSYTGRSEKCCQC